MLHTLIVFTINRLFTTRWDHHSVFEPKGRYGIPTVKQSKAKWNWARGGVKYRRGTKNCSSWPLSQHMSEMVQDGPTVTMGLILRMFSIWVILFYDQWLDGKNHRFWQDLYLTNGLSSMWQLDLLSDIQQWFQRYIGLMTCCTLFVSMAQLSVYTRISVSTQHCMFSELFCPAADFIFREIV